MSKGKWLTWTEEETERLKALREQKRTVPEIAEILGRSQGQVYNRIAYLNRGGTNKSYSQYRRSSYHREPMHAEPKEERTRKPDLPIVRKPFSFNPTPCSERELGAESVSVMRSPYER